MNLKRVSLIASITIVLIAVIIHLFYRQIVLMECCIKPNGFNLASSSNATIEIKRILCVGGTSGIGYATALAFLEKYSNIQVVVVGRKPPVIPSVYASRTKFVAADLSLTSVARQTADTLQNEHFDLVLFTIGITPDKFSRTSEGLEIDLAVSFMSRHVMLHRMLSQGVLNGSRVFLMGAPGFPMNPSLEDINWENVSYSFTSAHINTHLFNEGLVHYYAKAIPSTEFFGLSPGFILSDGLSRLAGPTLASVLAWLFPHQNTYARSVLLPLLVSKDIYSGSIFNNYGLEINPGPWFAPNPFESAKEIMNLVNSLLVRLGLQED